MEFNTDYEKIILDRVSHMINHTLKERTDTHITVLEIKGFVTDEPVPFERRLDYEVKPYQVGQSWGKLFQCGWFNLKGQVSKLHEPMYLKLDFGGEACLFDQQGTPIKGFTNGSSVFDRQHGEPGKIYYDITDLIDKDGNIDLWIDCGANDLFGSLQNDGIITHAEIVTRNLEIRKLNYHLETLLSLVVSLDRNKDRYREIYESLQLVYALVDYSEEHWLEKALEITENLLNKKSDNPLNVYAVGHAHIDLAWLWPIRETRRKIARTYASVIDLLEKYPDFIFGISQPQVFEWLKADYPELLTKLKKYIELGRIELQGGMWIESDTNVTGEESLVRQMLYGIKYYKDNFNFRVKNLWLPDVFGYSGNLPQIIKKSGLDYFMTIKISWNLVNRFPYHSFTWEGIDGSTVLCHMPPEGTYNSAIKAEKIIRTEQNYAEKDVAPLALSVYGIGNGGGGPGYEHLERIHRIKDLNPLPKVKTSRTDQFFEELNQYSDALPRWKGELYLENHQGTYTSQANVKRMNKLMEQKLKTLETVLALSNKYHDYHEEIEGIWKEVLLYQFHDILPGSSIERVYKECLARYEILSNKIDEILEKTLGASKEGYFFNPNRYPVSILRKVNDHYQRMYLEALSTKGIVTIYEKQSQADEIIETNNLKIKVCSKSGQLMITSKKGKKYFKNDYGNVLKVYQDHGNGWDINDNYRLQTPVLMQLKHQKITNYEHVVEIKNDYKFKASSVIETIVIDKETDLIDIKHQVDWKDLGYMLRAEFMPNINYDKATFDIQFGRIERSTRNDNMIEKAQFEVPGQQWVAVKDETNIFGIITKGKYGFHAKGHVLDVNLYRTTNYPCVNSDIGQTEYSYMIICGDETMSLDQIDRLGMIENAYYPRFNGHVELKHMMEIDNDQLELSAVKMSEDGEGFIYRYYNPTNSDICANYTVIENAFIKEVNLVEEEILEKINKDIKFKPFEVKTFKISVK